MKKILVVFPLLFASCNTPRTISQTRYKGALHYLSKDLYNTPFHVVDTLVYISQTYTENASDSTLDSLMALDEKYTFKNEYHAFNQKERTGSRLYNIYFSKPIQNTLCVEVLYNKGNPTARYSRLKSYNTGNIYFFRFDGHNKIIAVDTSIINYD